MFMPWKMINVILVLAFFFIALNTLIKLSATDVSA